MGNPVVVFVTKPHESAPLGIGMIRQNGRLVVSSIDKGGLFYDTELRCGMQVESINGTKCDGMPLGDAIGLLKAAEGQVTIVARAAAAATPVSTNPVAVPISDVPPGAPSGGMWGTNCYVGAKTQAAACAGCLCFGLPGLCILCCPFDERDAYKVGNAVYLADGRRVEEPANFEPKRSIMVRPPPPPPSNPTTTRTTPAAPVVATPVDETPVVETPVVATPIDDNDWCSPKLNKS